MTVLQFAVRYGRICARVNGKIKVKGIGVTGYGGLGVIELLSRHPQAEIAALTLDDFGSRVLLDTLDRLLKENHR